MDKRRSIKKVENSANLQQTAPSVPRNTSRTSKRTAERAGSKLPDSATLEILTQAFFMAQQAGYVMEVETVDNYVTVKIHSVDFVGGQLVPKNVVSQGVTQPEE